MSKSLVILGCSSLKLKNEEPLPAVIRYDGPAYKVFRSFLRETRWPTSLSVGILSAEYGLIGGLTQIQNYERRMDKARAERLKEDSTKTLLEWSKGHETITFFLGKDYLQAFDLNVLRQSKDFRILEGGIGDKLKQLHGFLREHRAEVRRPIVPKESGRPLYFLPDWDDMLDAEYDFKNDNFSHSDRSCRKEIHCVELMKPKRMCDGILVSLAQLQGTKGILKRFEPTAITSLSPQSIKRRYGLSPSQLAFGDCGAFSYVNEDEPAISVEQAAALYQLYGFDLGASVDHIPVPVIDGPKGKVPLSRYAINKRVAITRQNAERFLTHHRDRKYTFTPVGVIQARTADSYIKQLFEYIEMGYSSIAFGGLVPRNDRDIEDILIRLVKARKTMPRAINGGLWIHLFGVFRPKIQAAVRQAGISSFDSATYFRKAWLRSGQNYLGVDGKWYAAIRVPTTSDPRTLARLKASGLPIKELRRLESKALKALHEYDSGARSIGWTLRAVADYDFLLSRSDDHGENLLESYRKTLESRVWRKCACNVCSTIGIDALIFRGYNRNKRRGAHNTHLLYQNLTQRR